MFYKCKIVLTDEYSDSSDDDDEDDLFFDEAISYSDSSIDHDDPLLMHLLQETRARANDRNLAFHRALRKKKGVLFYLIKVYLIISIVFSYVKVFYFFPTSLLLTVFYDLFKFIFHYRSE